MDARKKISQAEQLYFSQFSRRLVFLVRVAAKLI